MDQQGGEDLLSGGLEHNAIVKAELTTGQGTVFAVKERRNTFSSSLARWIFGGYRSYVIALNYPGRKGEEYLGKLELVFDTGTVGATFFKRTVTFLLTGLAMNLALAAILFFVFHRMATRSILLLSDSLAKVNPERPSGFRIRLPQRHADDELGLLVTRTNDLLHVVGSNIQRRKEAEDAVQQLNRELEDRVEDRTRELEFVNKELESFAYTVSHDLRGPARAMGGLATALIEDHGARIGDEGRRYLDLLLMSTRQMEELIDDLLEFSRSTRREAKFECVNLSLIAADILERRQVEEPDRQVEVKIEADIQAEGDPTFLRQVLENLLGNAWKYSCNRKLTRISFFTRKSVDKGVIYCVQDNGVGFDISQAHRIFLPFQRLHGNKDFSGTGIGLATVEKIIFRHGGKIWVEAEVDKGATFFFTLG